MFQLKNFVSIAASMINYVRSTTGKVTDVQPGSVTRTLLEAPAAEIEELYIQMFNGLREAIPVAVFRSFSFPPLPAAYAHSKVTVTVKDPANYPKTENLIPAGTQFLTADGRVYQIDTDVTWPVGFPAVTFNVISREPGFSQNAAVGQIIKSPSFDPDIYAFSSTEATGGKNAESDDERLSRFGDYIKALSRGTETAIRYGASTALITDAQGNVTESVTRIGLNTEINGYIQVFIWGSAGAPSSALLARTQEIETGKKDPDTLEITPGFAAAGVRCEVSSMVLYTVDITAKIRMQADYDLHAPGMPQRLADAVESLLSGIMPGETLYFDEIRSALLQVKGVSDVLISSVSHEIAPASADGSTPARFEELGNIVCGINQVLALGKLTADKL